jgi:alcohol dehydrogenase class IV
MNRCTHASEDIPSELRKFLAPEFVFGVGARNLVGTYAAHLGVRNVLLVTDPGVAAAGWTEQAAASLESAGLRYSIYDQVTANPRVDEVAAGAARYRELDCDGLVAVGGGSPIDCAKGIGIVVANGRPITEFEGVDRVEVSLPPLLCIPTTGGAAADVSQFAILSFSREARKISVISKALVPDISLVDPACLTTLPPYESACTGIDALSHAIEAYVSSGHSPFTDLHAQEAIRLIGRHLLPSIANGNDMNARSGMALAALQAGLAFSNASLGAVHALSHVLGGRLDLAHGECNALLLEHVTAYNFSAAPKRYCCIAELLGVEVGNLDDGAVNERLQRALHDLRVQAGISGSLSLLGIHKADIPDLARDALRDACIVTNPRLPTRAEIEAIYVRAL